MAYDDEYDLAPEPAAPPKRQTRAAAATQQAGRAPTTAASSAGGFARGPLVVVKDGARLPDRCVKCNGPAADGRITKRFTYDEPDQKNAVLALMPVIGVFYKFVWLIGKLSRGVDRITVSYCVCKKHRQVRAISTAAALGLVAIGLLVFINGMKAKSGGMVLAGAAMWVVAAVVALTGIRTFQVVSCYNNTAELKGAGRAFLDSLPKPGAYRPPAY
jgi:hypothetical protein